MPASRSCSPGCSSTWLLTACFWHPLRGNSAALAPFDQVNIALIYAVTLGLIAIFTASYRVFVRPKSLRAGLLFGLLLGLALGTAVGFGTYIHAPIPLALAWGWFIAGTIKGVAAGRTWGVGHRGVGMVVHCQ